jgi:hypothetical protein
MKPAGGAPFGLALAALAAILLRDLDAPTLVSYGGDYTTLTVAAALVPADAHAAARAGGSRHRPRGVWIVVAFRRWFRRSREAWCGATRSSRGRGVRVVAPAGDAPGADRAGDGRRCGVWSSWARLPRA